MSALARLEKMPDWPARMTADVASVYMGISKSTFATRFGAIGVKEGANVLWAKVQLDRIIAKQFALPQLVPNGDGDSTWDDLR
jgi:hypothetical protein